ncbi:Hypothetical_protein [Hexamita inflata]|uniref:Hypothetical_protein n=1 Tax=Hexamita inflata TaxID=28002 RepID=A0AA86N9S1_9EUKA|nr:Hypothetical protein HINF_LOCUS3055 [Hexamita inflata]CAI9928894.1 Hypothetical protein HINF_LOCUS16539 [Hexamita inflata]CAI9942880.1 Hypothetical protein HINF_LOCUS30525 [Hexamita inflata]
MPVCQIIEKSLFKRQHRQAFYEIQNNCIVLHYFVDQKKVEHFFNFDNLLLTQETLDKDIFFDKNTNIHIILDKQNKQQNENMECEDLYFEFEPKSSSLYLSEPTDLNGSFTSAFGDVNNSQYFEI